MRVNVSLILCALGLCLVTSARAQPSCDDTTVVKNPVYIQAEDTQVPTLKALGKRLRAQANPITIVYSSNGSCSNVAYMYQNKFTPNVNAGGTYYIPADPNFDPNGTPPNCTPSGTLTPDMGMSIVFVTPENCPTAGTPPSDVAAIPGPVQALLFIAPKSSSQIAITAEEAYLVFGLGPTRAMVPPWTDPAFLYGRTPTKGTQIGIGASIGVPAGRWQLLNDPMHQIDQAAMVATRVATHNTDGNADKALGILGNQLYDQMANRQVLKGLAFRAFQQRLAYWPDSTPTSFDKKNVRDGHYPMWTYVQYVTRVSGTGSPVKPAIKTLIDLLNGNTVSLSPEFEPLDDQIDNGMVPACAMGVQRSIEGGELSLYAAEQPCGCYFDARVQGGTTSCQKCSTATPCASGVCRHGYCEVR